MKHTPLNHIVEAATVHAAPFPAPMTREQKLERWAELLERAPDRSLRSLGEIEFRPADERPMMRVDGSPLTVAFEDPVLRAEGLASDRLGDATAFFNLSDHDAHRLLCSCHNGLVMKAGTVAKRVRAMAQGRLQPSALLVYGALVAIVGGLPFLAYML